MRIGAPAVFIPWVDDHPPRVFAVSHLGARLALARRLGLAATATDPELIEAAWRRWGPSAPAELTGPFALAVHGPGQSVLLARDHLGQFPLYYARLPAGVVVSTDLEAVLDHPQVGAELDLEVAACQYAHAYLALADRTPFRQVAKVPAAHAVVLTRSGAQERRYWDPAAVAPQGGRPEDWVERMRAVLLDAVADAVPAGGAVGAHVSGGLDSTAVAVLAGRQLRADGRRLAAVYSWSPAPPPGQVVEAGAVGHRVVDERWLVGLTAQAEDWTVTYVPPRAGVAGLLAADDPMRRPQAAWNREVWVARDAAARGVPVLLTGWGGDEAASFNGRNLVPWLAGRGRLLPAYRELRRRAEVTGDPAVLRSLLTPLLPDGLRRAGRRLRPQRQQGINLDQARRLVWSEHGPFVRDALAERHRLIDAARSPHDYQLALLRLGHLQARCESWYAGGGRVGVGYRYPLLDPRLVELALAAPAECFRRDGWSRPCFRRAVEPFLPAAVVWNPVKQDPSLNGVVIGAFDPAAEPPVPPGLEALDALRRQARDLARHRN